MKRGQAGGTAVAVDEPKPALDQKGTRRAPRVRDQGRRRGAVDGNPAALVDLSTVGAQVVSATVLKPNQRVRVIMGDGKAPMRCSGVDCVGGVRNAEGPCRPRYRAGIDFG